MAKIPKQRFGSKAQVMNGTALMTTGRLKKGDLKYNKRGRIVSKKRSARAKRERSLKRQVTKQRKVCLVRSKRTNPLRTFPKKSFPKEVN